MKVRPERGSAQIDAERRALVASARVGPIATFVAVAGAVPYLALTWEEPHRLTAAVLLVVGALAGLLVRRLPVERIVTSPWGASFFVGWSVADIGLITALAASDGGLRSPFSLILFLTLVFAGLFYPPRLLAPVAALNAAAAVAIGVLGSPQAPETGAAYPYYFAICLGTVGWLCFRQSQGNARARQELERASRTDPLTGSLNRRGFAERLEGVLDSSRRAGTGFGFLILDIDDFKHINDAWGHVAGDHVLVAMARSVKRVIRPMDSLARLGGDEFAVLLPGIDPEDLEAVEARVCEATGEYASCSTGTASFPADGADLDDLLRHADERMYRGKGAELACGERTPFRVSGPGEGRRAPGEEAGPLHRIM